MLVIAEHIHRDRLRQAEHHRLVRDVRRTCHPRPRRLFSGWTVRAPLVLSRRRQPGAAFG
jgi:hypothetical protein